MSKDLQWMIIRNCSSFLVKKPNVRKHFSTDPFNVKNIHSPRFCGVIHKKALTVEPHPTGKGVNFVFKKRRFQKKPSKNVEKVPLTRGGRRTMKCIKSFCNTHRYRRDLKNLALRRASAILKSQRVLVSKKKSPRKKAE